VADVFCRRSGVFCGSEEVRRLLAGRKIEMYAIPDGERYEAGSTVMRFSGRTASSASMKPRFWNGGVRHRLGHSRGGMQGSSGRQVGSYASASRAHPSVGGAGHGARGDDAAALTGAVASSALCSRA